MIRLHVICEGHTEEMFVNELLMAPMMSKGVLLCPAKIGRPGHKGGNVNFQRLIADVRLRLLRDPACYCTTLLDYYGLPSAFPGKASADAYRNSQAKYQTVSDALSREVERVLGEAARRFIPYIQMHEFEGLLFSEPEILAESIYMPQLAESFGAIRNQFLTPEDINDSANTAPSKRIERHFPGYDKPIHPLLAAGEIGLEAIRRECPLFDGWIQELESLA